MDANLVVMVSTCLTLLVIPAVAWVALRDRRGRVWVAVLAPVLYLVLGNLLSRVILGDLIYDPELAAAVGGDLEQQRRFILHTLASMGSSAVLILALVAGLRQVLPLVRRHYGAGS